MKYDAVILDLDGTLLNTLPDIKEIVNSVTGSIGMAPFTEERIKAAVGSGVENLLRKLGVPEQWNAALAGEISSRYALIREPAACIYPGVEEMLDSLFKNIPRVCVLSNKPEEALAYTLKHYFPGYPFALAKGSEPGNPAKPEPEVLLQMLMELKVIPEKALMVGDGEADCLVARSAGTDHLGVLWGFRTRARLETEGAVNFATVPGDVLRFMALEP